MITEGIEQVQYIPQGFRYFTKWSGKIVGNHLNHLILIGAKMVYN